MCRISFNVVTKVEKLGYSCHMDTFLVFSSPEPKVELLVSDGADPAFMVRPHVFRCRRYRSSLLKLLARFFSNLVRSILVTVLFEFAIIILIDPI